MPMNHNATQENTITLLSKYVMKTTKFAPFDTGEMKEKYEKLFVAKHPAMHIVLLQGIARCTDSAPNTFLVLVSPSFIISWESNERLDAPPLWSIRTRSFFMQPWMMRFACTLVSRRIQKYFSSCVLYFQRNFVFESISFYTTIFCK